MLQETQNLPKETESTLTEGIKIDVWNSIQEFFNLGFHFGEGENQIHITIGLLFLVITSFVVVSYLLKITRVLVTRKMEDTDKFKFVSVFNFVKYLVFITVFFIILSMAGVNITPYLTTSAALLVGLGLALQGLFQDIIGGIIIILDKSLSVGDIIEIDKKVGRVLEIKLRTTRTITQDDKIIVIPNHKFISNNIYNYTQNRKTTRDLVNVGVAYGSNIDTVKKLLLESVSNQKGILKNPKPFVVFEDFGESALLFSVYFFINDSFSSPFLRSEIRFKIDALFRNNNIKIPFPQRDVHLFETKK